MPAQTLENKVAFVTGIGSGIGRASALLFAAEGATVAGVDINGDALPDVIDKGMLRALHDAARRGGR